MSFLQALQLAQWVNEHPPATAAPVPEREGWAVAITLDFVNVTTGGHSTDREVVRSRADARAALGY